MDNMLTLVRHKGQIESAAIAKHFKITEREVATKLYPSIVAGSILQCDVIRPGQKPGKLYRWSGWAPPRTAGAPTAAARARRECDE